MSNLGTRKWRELTARHKAACRRRNLPCWRCTLPIDYDLPSSDTEAFESDHYWPRHTHPHLTYDLANLRPSHQTCNRSRGDEQPGDWVRAEEW